LGFVGDARDNLRIEAAFAATHQGLARNLQKNAAIPQIGCH